MKNELGRKITSLTLMTIMFAGGLTIAAPSFMPEAVADEKLLYVSAENSLFGNTFAGGQIVEIIVRDPARDETDEKQGEPNVTVSGEILRMLQGTDGYWYAYIMSTAAAVVADANTNVDIGTALTQSIGPGSNIGNTRASGTNTSLEQNLTIGVSSTATVYTATDGSSADGVYGKVSAPDLSGTQKHATLGLGQLNVTEALWPFIQTWEFKDASGVEIIFAKPGADEVVELTFETAGTGMEDYASIELDRSSGPQGAEIFMTIYDNQLNLDPTEADSVAFLTNGTHGVSFNASTQYVTYLMTEFGDNGKLKIDMDAASIGTNVLFSKDNADCIKTAVTASALERTGGGFSGYHCFGETGSNTGIFTNADDTDTSTLKISTSAKRGTTASIDYNDAAQSVLVTTSGATIDMVESDAGDEWNSGEPVTVQLTDADRNLTSASDESLTIATSQNIPTISIGSPFSMQSGNAGNATAHVDATTGVVKLVATAAADTAGDEWTVQLGPQATHAFSFVNAMNSSMVFRYLALDVSDLCTDSTVDVAGLTAQTYKGVISYGTADLTTGDEDLVCNVAAIAVGDEFTVVYDFMAFGPDDNHSIYRIEMDETGDNTGVFTGDVEFIMLNQNTIDVANTALTGPGTSVTMLMTADLTGSSAPRVQYNDTDADGVYTGIADQLDAPTHSGTVTFDSESYKVADTVTITVTDQDLNTDSDLIDVYITQTNDRVGDGDADENHILDVYFGDVEYNDDCESVLTGSGLFDTGFQLTESGAATGVFSGTFQIPSDVCISATASATSVGKDMFTNYWDYRDAGGNEIETGSAATVAANSGSISLDKSVYPVPYDNTSAQFKDHADAAVGWGNVTVTVTVSDPDYDMSPSGEDTIPAGKVWVEAVRGSTTATIESSFPLTETEASSGVFDYEFTINASSVAGLGATALRQGDVITATYNDTTDASGNPYINTDSSTLDLRTGSLLADKSVYVIGSDAIITIVDPDLNRDSGTIESYVLNLVEWDSDAGTTELGTTTTSFDAEPGAFRETGSDTGIFQTVIEIPTTVGSAATAIDQGEAIGLEYVDFGSAGENYYGDDTTDVGLTIYTSNFGATIELDSKVYTWTDRVFVTIVAPDHNTDTGLVNEIGGSGGTLTAQTRESKLTAYKMVETGVDTGIFWGEITLQGFAHDADGDATNDAPFGGTQSAASTGPTNGLLKASEADGITVSFEYTEDSTVVQSSLIRWNIGETSFSEDSYLSSSSAVVSVIDPDMNINPDSVENFSIDVYSDSDSGGIELTVTETNESTGVFEATVFFTTSAASSGHTLRVSEGDSITAEYSDHTLPSPYSTSDDIDVSATAVIGTSTPPLERAPVANARVVDAFGNSLAEVSVDQQVQIEADLVNGQDGDQSFAYLVQVQDSDGVTVSLAWITGQLAAGQSFSPALSWIPNASGSYEATVFVWESVDNPTALSDTASVSITVV